MKRRIVLDTNCLLQVVSRRSPNHLVWSSFINGVYQLCVSTEILNEYEEIIGQKMSPQIASMLVEVILRSPYTLRFDAHYHWNLIKQDPDDNKFVDCALIANADYIVSEDAHFRILNELQFPPISLLKLNEFMQLLKAQDQDSV